MTTKIDFNKIKEFFKKNWKNVLIIILLLLLGIYFISNSYLKNALSKSKEDLDKANKELVISKNKADELYASTQGFIISQKDLKKENRELYDEIKKYKSHPIVINKVTTETKLDTVYLTNNVVKDKNKFTSNWSFNKQFGDSANVEILGYSSIQLDSLLNVIKDHSELTKLSIKSKMYVGLNEKDGKLEIYARSTNPLINISSLDGYMIDPQKSEVLKKVYKPRKLSIGLQAGYGLSLGNTKLVPYIGIGLNYRLIQF